MLLAEAKKSGVEGLIAKRRDSRYEPGRRSGAWQKIKLVNEQEFVIGGYTEPKGSRPFFGAILAGYYDKGKLIFASKAGTGFDHESLEMLYKKFQRLKTDPCPFANLPVHRRGQAGLSGAEMRRCTWVKPELVCQIRFTEWTADGGLRHPVFVGLRDDKKPTEVVRELPKGG
jgi:bifunctional non-homologous end joining protein LigD